MEVNTKKIVKSLIEIFGSDENNGKLVRLWSKAKSIPIDDIFQFLSEKIVDSNYTEHIGEHFDDILLLIVTKSFSFEVDDFNLHQRRCIALSKLLKYSPDIQRFAIMYFSKTIAPFDTKEKNPPKKRAAKSIESTVNSFELVDCCYRLLKSDVTFYKNAWNWSKFVEAFCLSTEYKENDGFRLVCNNILALLTNMNSSQLSHLNANVSLDAKIDFEDSQKNVPKHEPISLSTTSDGDRLVCDFANNVLTNVEGVLLPIFDSRNLAFFEKGIVDTKNLIMVESTKVNLRSVALGVAAGKAVCLSGPVGCGKTSLVEYLAATTGRVPPKFVDIDSSAKNSAKENQNQNIKTNGHGATKGSKRRHIESANEPEIDPIYAKNPPNGFLRIQLGDQTDSKMLLGQYRCTDVPGEFVWQPGVLTQAVMHGYWLLLEDLDSCTQDVCTILTNLLENNYLSVPGFRDALQISSGFQLFITMRTNKGTHGQNSFFQLLEKYLYTINVLSLSKDELCAIIQQQYPKLASIASRMVDVFVTFSSGCHSTDADEAIRSNCPIESSTSTEDMIVDDAISTEAEDNLRAARNSGRLVSTRDLLKLCNRSSPTFSITSAECAYFVFQNAVDLFCSHLTHGDAKSRLITSIGAKLGIIPSRCDHLANEHKPSVNVSGTRDVKIGRVELSRRADDTRAADQMLKRISDEDLDQSGVQKRLKIDATSHLTVYQQLKRKVPNFSFTRLASCVLERIAVAVQQNEPVLLVGETGVGKTSSVQYLSYQTNHKLVAINMNNQSDVSDLVGGFKPVDLSFVIAPLRSEFEYLFRQTFNAIKNEKFLNNISACCNQGEFDVLIRLMLKIVDTVFQRKDDKKDDANTQKDARIYERWAALKVKLMKLNSQIKNSINISFAFITGSLVNCIRNGDWVLLDEINLASTETLECLSTILEPNGSIVLLERGDFTPVKRHPDFRIFACMNPSTDIGKKDLPVGIRNRFTEFFVDELTAENDLIILVSDYLRNTGIQQTKVLAVVKLYQKLRSMAQLELNDGLGNRPVYSLRTLCRALSICAKNLCGSIERNLYESFCLSFLTQLDPASHLRVLDLIQKSLLSNKKAVLSQKIPRPDGEQIGFEGYWIQKGPKEPELCESYILTESVKENLRDLARIVSIGKLPVLLQGPTSAGKTSLIDYVARRSGNYCLRINNHEHTDLQEYIGTYTADVSGKLSFKEGVLVQAMKNGYWIILDELNLAPSDILEALNRVLDDNRELFIPETQELIKAHPNFMLFATQNPPGLYGGRKTLSRAFKNRFIELHFSEIPRSELEIILEKRCLIPKSYAQKMVKTMAELQASQRRENTTKGAFTLRDLFRWGNRYTFANKELLSNHLYDWNQHLVDEGYLVLSSKIRNEHEVHVIEETLYKTFRKKIDVERLFSLSENTSMVTKSLLEAIASHKNFSNVVWTHNMRRMAVLTGKALEFNEPVLLVGPTGCGKTTICQILADIVRKELRILNCHMHTEGADFLGGLRPYRGEQKSDENEARQLFEWSNGPLILSMIEGSFFLADEISLAEDSVLERLNCVLEPERTILLAEKGGCSENFITDDTNISGSGEFVIRANEGFQFLATMNPGGDFGKKELSPALRNRFTEIWCRSIDGREDLIKIAEHSLKVGYQLIDSPTATDMLVNDIATIVVDATLFIKRNVDKFNFSVRDILAWVQYVTTNSSVKSNDSRLAIHETIIFGLETMFLDGLEMLPHESIAEIEAQRLTIFKFVVEGIRSRLQKSLNIQELQTRKGNEIENTRDSFGISPFFVAANPERDVSRSSDFKFTAPTTQKNLFRLLSAMSLPKAILLEGPPGVGKTSLIENVASAIGYEIVRINLCEHTDLADLFGTDQPSDENSLNLGVSSDDTKLALGSFVWRDGPLLAALKAPNTWILLDELNLAPQSVLEGLNAILDHRGEVYIPELNKTFKLGQKTRIFASQNPLRQGGGRKGLPQSFLNRFTKVYLRKLNADDLCHVVNAKYGKYFVQLKSILASNSVNQSDESYFIARGTGFDCCERMVTFSERIDNGISNLEFGYKGGPYEVNLRDILRWCDLLSNDQTGFKLTATSENLDENYNKFMLTLFEKMKLVYCHRMRTDVDQAYIRRAFGDAFVCDVEELERKSNDVCLFWNENNVYLNDVVLSTNNDEANPLNRTKSAPLMLTGQRELLKALAECVIMEMPVILCGPSDSGKTKLVDVICTLSNRFCNVDTIDDSVTGSFQQIDLNRHLEEIAQSAYAQFIQKSQEIVLNEWTSKTRVKVFVELLRTWEKFNELNRIQSDASKQSAMSEELIIFKQRLNRLASMLSTLEKITSAKDIDLLKAKLRALELVIRNAETLNTGGHFEWIDSKIVRALKLGQFICLEHVNLCSSAILDRLNSVFETDGKLLLSEKGVSASSGNQSESVSRHRNFRAFLTLDPKNGEISRAMRNRCVELNIEKDAYSVEDLRKLIYENGIREVYCIDWILRVHESVRKVAEFNSFGVSHLTKLAFLVAENRRLGKDDTASIYASALEVYVRSSHVDLLGYGLNYYRGKLIESIVEDLKSTPRDQTNRFNFGNLILHADEMTQSSMIRLQAEPLRAVLSVAQDKLTAEDAQEVLYSLNHLLTERNVFSDEQTPRYLLYILYELCSIDDLSMRRNYLRKILSEFCDAESVEDVKTSKKISIDVKVKQNKVSVENMLQSNGQISAYKTIESAASGEVSKESDEVKTKSEKFNLYEVNESLALAIESIGSNALKSLPWNQQIFPRIRDYDENNKMSTNEQLKISAILLAHLSIQRVKPSNVTKLSQVDALTYSKAVGDSSISDSVAIDLITSLHPFLDEIKNAVVTKLRNDDEIDFDRYVNFAVAFLWTNRLLAVSKSRLFVQKNVDDSLIDNLILHFNWLQKHLMKELSEVIESEEFEKNQRKILNYIERNYHPLSELRKRFVKSLTNFVPFFEASQLKLHKCEQELAKQTKLISKFELIERDELVNRIRLVLSNESLAIRRKLLECQRNDELFWLSDLKNRNPAHAELTKIVELGGNDVDFDTIAEEFRNFKRFGASLESNTDVKDLTSLKLIISLLPLLEYFALRSMNPIQSGHSGNFNLNEEFFIRIRSLGIDELKLLKLISCGNFKLAESMWKSAANEDEIVQVMKSLPDGFYRNYSTLIRLVQMRCRLFALNSIASNQEICNEALDCETSIKTVASNSVVGPLLSNATLSAFCDSFGRVKSSGLGNLDIWRKSLSSATQILWNNIETFQKSFDFKESNTVTSSTNAKKLLAEIKFIREQTISTTENAEFLKYFDQLIDLLASEVSLDEKSFFKSSKITTIVGAIELNLLSFMPLLDPVERNRLKRIYAEEDQRHVGQLINAYEFMKVIMAYDGLGESIVRKFEAKRTELSRRHEKYSNKCALRPDHCLYNRLTREVNHFLCTCCHPKTLATLVETIANIHARFADAEIELARSELAQATEVIKRIDLWINNAARFQHQTLSQYTTYYRDFTLPIESSLTAIVFGLTELKHDLIKQRDSIVFREGSAIRLCQNETISDVLVNLVEFPSVRRLKILSSEVENRSTINISDALEKLSNREPAYVALMKSKVQEIKNVVIAARKLDDIEFSNFESTLRTFNQIWKSQEESKRKRLAEEESLYVTKTKCETEDDEEVINEEIENIFPNTVEDDFGEFVQNATLEQVKKKAKPKSTSELDDLDADDLRFVCESFIDLMHRFTGTEYYKPTAALVAGEQKSNAIESFEKKVAVFRQLVGEYRTTLDDSVDRLFYNGIGLLLGIAQNQCQQLELNENAANVRAAYNFYKDPNIVEIHETMPLLDRLEKRVYVELEQWPDHAVLNDIIRIIARIRALPFTAPIVRFSTGFQILRQKVDEWNSVAHKANHLRDLEAELALFIQRWTKLELQCWRECLNITFDRIQSKAYRYWFFVYNLLNEYLGSGDDTSIPCDLTDFKSVEKCFGNSEVDADAEKANETKAKLRTVEVISVLKQFIESSNYGEFSMRMRILKSFELYLHRTTIGSEKRRHGIIAVVHNLHLYYTQFFAEIEDSIRSMRTPIEKKLKEFVKIESYNKDLSYFSMKNNVTRVHRHLHKFLREFETSLNGKIATVFVWRANQPTLLVEPKAKIEINDAFAIDVKRFVASSKLKEQFIGDIESIDDQLQLLSRADKLFMTSRNIVKQAILHSQFPGLICSLETILGEQIETCEYLRKLEVDRTQEKPRQKSQAKHMLQQKRKALADAYKTLSTLGLSYRSGLLETTLNTNLVDLKIVPFCTQTMITKSQKHPTVDRTLVKVSDSVDHFFARSVFKLKLLQTILLQPNPELGLSNIERVKGFAVDTFLLVQQQRTALAKSVTELHQLQQSIRNILDLHESLADQKSNFVELKNRFIEIETNASRIVAIFEEFDLLLNCVPNESDINLTAVASPNVNAFTKSSDKYKKIRSIVSLVLQKSKSLVGEMSTFDKTIFHNSATIEQFAKTFDSIVNDIETIQKVAALNSEGEYLIVVKPIVDLLVEIQAKNIDAVEDKPRFDEKILENFNNELENIVHQILLSMQNIYKKYSLQKENLYETNEPQATTDDKVNDVDGDAGDGEDEGELLQSNHLKQKIVQEMNADLSMLNSTSILSKLSNVFAVVRHTNDTQAARRLTLIAPILEQFELLGKFYLIQQFGAHRTSTKLLNLMLTVFIELTAKGFCIPPDLMQDEDGEQNENEDGKEGEGFGLEDGTGEKDVSDKIESEDQLDTAKKPGDENQTDDKEDADCKEEKGIDMSEDFDSKLQDVEKRGDESENEQSDNEDDLDKQMGETEEGADKLDDQIWGSDDEKEDEDEEDEDDEMNDEQDGKGSKEEKDDHNNLDSKNDTKESENDEALDAANNDQTEKKKQDKDIDQMQEPDVGEDQPNPFHNELEEPPEPEDIDLGDINLDNQENNENDEQREDDNPFDIDTMKENMEVEEDENGENDEEENAEKSEEKVDGDDDESDSNDDDENDGETKHDEANVDNEDGEENQEENAEEPESQTRGEQEPETEAPADDENVDEKENRKELNEDFEESKDKRSEQENVQAMPENKQKGSTDQVQVEAPEKQEQENKMDEQDTGEDKEGVGQAENEESKSGHQGVTDAKETQTKDKQQKRKDANEKRKQGATDEERTISETPNKERKQLKTIEKTSQEERDGVENEENEEDKEIEADEHQHVKDAKKTDKTTMDNATEEQSKKTQHEENAEEDENEKLDEENGDELMETNEDEDDESDDEIKDPEKLQSEKNDKEKQSKEKGKRGDQNKENCEVDEAEVEGEIVPTYNVQRNNETKAHCAMDIVQDSCIADEMTNTELLEMRKMYENERATNRIVHAQPPDFELWQTISNKMAPSARELCEQLRLILEPTKCTRLKGDYRTGRRINMKKIIPYIASQFRKDKIWLRRTKPAQRDYKITIAIDDSKSMDYNNSKTMTLQAISLVSQALTLLESGRLSIVSFGESPQIILNHHEQFEGPKLVQTLNFEQNKSRIAELLDFVRIACNEDAGGSSDNGIFENLLLVLSDGRNISSEGDRKVRNAIKLARLQRIFIVYIIVENPENKFSIWDIRKPVFTADGKMEPIKSYMDSFPFPYYVIVRDLAQLPIVLSDAMRQWFELVSSEQ